LFGEVVSLGNDGVIKIKEKSHEGQYDDSGSTIATETYADFLKYVSN